MSEDIATQQNQEAERTFGIVHQFIKDLSFENLLSTQEIISEDYSPTGEISFSVNTRPVNDGVYEVMLSIKIEAKDEEKEKSVYLLEADYGGIIHLEGFPEEEVKAVLIIEVGRLLFPFLRSVVSSATRDGGFNPLVLQPIDFVALYMQQVEEESESESDA